MSFALVAAGMVQLQLLGAVSPSFPFSWDTIPRYTFCVNSSTATQTTTGVFDDAAAAYIARQPIYINNPTLARPPGSISDEESRMPQQAAKLRALNPRQQQLFYYAIDLVGCAPCFRPTGGRGDAWGRRQDPCGGWKLPECCCDWIPGPS